MKKMKQKQSGILILIVLIFVIGCTITTKVNPITEPEISNLCIKYNKDIFVKEFGQGLKDLLAEKGINAEIYEGDQPEGCYFRMEYTAEWSWDMAMYLEYAHEHHLLTSSGSDSHGPDKKPIKYPAELSRNLLERVGIQVK